MRIAICDEQAEYRRQAEAAIRTCLRGTEYGVDAFPDGPSLLHAFKKRPYDLIFLDIEMPEMNGISVARHLRQLHDTVPIVFLTSHVEYAVVGYEVSALRYLTKPVSVEKIREVLDFVASKMQEQRVLWVKTELSDEKLHIKDILFMEAQNQNVLIHTVAGDYSVRYNLSDYETELQDDGFYRIHRGYLVSLRQIKRTVKNEVTLTDGSILPVSRTKERGLREALFQYTRKEAF